MQESLLVLYYGPDAAETEQRWVLGDRPFDLVGRTSDDEVLSVLIEEDVDCLVCTGGPDVFAVIDRVRESLPHVPVVVFGTGDLDAATALDHGVTHHVDVGEDDRIEALEALESVVAKYRRERRERTMLDSLLENIPLSVYFKDRKSRHVRVSDEMPELNGPPYLENPEGKRFHTPEDIVGTSDFDLYPSELAEEAVADDDEVVETEEPIVNRIEHAFGSPYDGMFVATSKAPWYDDRGNVIGTVGVTRDISERKQYENQLERQNERLERFARVISHDLRNPLEVARGRLEFARDDGDAEHFEAIERSLTRMDDLIDDVLALARHGEAVSDPETVDVSTAARDAWAVVESHGATLDVQTDVTVHADSGRLSQLFENLFRNCVEHGSEDPATLTITVGDFPLRAGFFVADDGVGIPEAERDSVFDAGFSTGDDGTGLGLSIVRSIADAHGWNVQVAESDDGGARFEFKNTWGTQE